MNLGSNGIGPSGAQSLSEALKSNSTLTTLNLDENDIQDSGIKFIADILKRNSKLETLTLNKNKIKNVGAIYLSEVLKCNEVLMKLELNENEIGIDGIKCLSKNKLKSIQVKIDDNSILESEIITILKNYGIYFEDEQNITRRCHLLAKKTKARCKNFLKIDSNVHCNIHTELWNNLKTNLEKELIKKRKNYINNEGILLNSDVKNNEY